VASLQRLLLYYGATTGSADSHKFGPILRENGYDVTDEQVRTRLKNTEYKWYQNHLAKAPPQLHNNANDNEMPVENESDATSTTSPLLSPHEMELFNYNEGGEAEMHPTAQFRQEIAILEFPQIGERMDVWITDDFVFIATGKTPIRDVTIQVLVVSDFFLSLCCALASI